MNRLLRPARRPLFVPGRAAALALLGGAVMVAPAPLAAEEIAADVARLGWLDKITARVGEQRVTVGDTVTLGPLRITVDSCIRRVPPDDPESAALLEIRETAPDHQPAQVRQEADGRGRPVFTGWMFASSPSLSAMDHGVYDVWVLDCEIPADRAAGDVAPAPADAGPVDGAPAADPATEGPDPVPLD